MIKTYKYENHHFVEADGFQDFTYILSPNKTEIEHIADYYDFPHDYMTGILDDDENARFEVDDEGNVLLLLQYPAQEGDRISTYPYSLVFTKNRQIIFGLNHECELAGIFNRAMPEESYQQEILFDVMNTMTRSFHTYLADFKKRLRLIEDELKDSTENSQIEHIIRLQAALIYFEAALEDNLEVYQKVMAYLRQEGHSVVADMVYDVYVEANQSLTTTQILLKLLDNLSDLFSSIVSNNLNIIMKIMTSATFVLTIATVVGGLYGMNVALPIQNWPHAFWIIMTVILVSCWITILVMKRKKML
jgi:magnesium transporter